MFFFISHAVARNLAVSYHLTGLLFCSRAVLFVLVHLELGLWGSFFFLIVIKFSSVIRDQSGEYRILRPGSDVFPWLLNQFTVIGKSWLEEI